MNLSKHRRLSWSVLVIALAVVTLPKTAHADEPDRHGFTLELGLGPGFTYLSGGGQSIGKFGVNGLSLSLGGYITPNIAVVARAAGVTTPLEGGTLVAGVYGVSVEGWIGDFYLSAGPGLGLLAGVGSGLVAFEKGFGLDVRAGWAFYHSKHHALSIGLESTPAFYSDATVVGTGLDFEWHYF